MQCSLTKITSCKSIQNINYYFICMNYKQIHQKSIEIQQGDSLLDKNTLVQEGELDEQKERALFGFYHRIAHKNQNQGKSEVLNINEQINHFYEQRKENLLYERWKLKRAQTSETISMLNASLDRISSKNRKIKLVSPIRKILDKYKITSELNQEHSFFNQSLQKQYRVKDKHQHKTFNKYGNFRQGSQESDIIKKATNERARTPRYLVVTSHQFYMRNKGNEKVSKQKIQRKQTNKSKNSLKNKVKQTNKDSSSKNSIDKNNIRSSSRPNEKYIAPWVEQLHQRLFQNRARIPAKDQIRSDKNYKLKRIQFQNVIRQSRQSSKLLTKAQIDELFDQLKDENMPLWRSSILNYNFAKLKRIHFYQSLGNSIQRR